MIVAHRPKENITMRAITQNTVGGPEVLTLADLPAPQPKPGEIGRAHV